MLRRKSWVTAMPMDAKAREVRSQARNVRSNRDSQSDMGPLRLNWSSGTTLAGLLCTY